MLCDKKSKFRTESDALNALDRLRFRYKDRKTANRVYLCECGLWHLTSKSGLEFILKERILILEKENQALKKENSSLQSRISKQGRENTDLKKDISRLIANQTNK